jgi:hypothetical protein
MQSLPISFTPFFQEYDIAALYPQKDSDTIIGRVLHYGNREEFRWLFDVYSNERIKVWVKR